MADKVLGPYVDRIETTPDMVWPSNEGRLNEIEKEVFYTVTFESNGGSGVPNQLVEPNGIALEPANPIRDGYSFTGWFSDGELASPYNFSTPVTTNLTLYAGWTNN